MRRFIEHTPNGPVLIQHPEGVEVKSVLAKDRVEINAGDHDYWDHLHKQLKTGELDFDKVKREKGLR